MGLGLRLSFGLILGLELGAVRLGLELGWGFGLGLILGLCFGLVLILGVRIGLNLCLGEREDIFSFW